MSYNYLPLDRKWLSFQQVKNLLDYDQLVSITFDAHERILKGREYLDSLQQKESEQQDEQIIEQGQYNLLKNAAGGIGEEAPMEVVKLMLMLKIKSLSFGNSGVQIETVKRLMEMYNNGVLPVVYTIGSAGVDGDAALLSQVSLPTLGLGEVYYDGQKKPAAEVFSQLNWQPLRLQSNEALGLISGTQFTSAYGLFTLKKTERLLKLADAIAAVSIQALDGNTGFLHKNVHSTQGNKGQENTAAPLWKYLESDTADKVKSAQTDPYSFRSVPQVHGAAKDAFDYVLKVFLSQVNSVSESTVIYPDNEIIVSAGNFHAQPLALALDFLCLSLASVAGISAARTNQLTNGMKALANNLREDVNNEKYKVFMATAAAIMEEIKQLSAPASLHTNTLNREEDFLNSSAQAAVKSLRLVDRLEEVLAIELMIARKVFNSKNPAVDEVSLPQLLHDFNQKSNFNDENILLKNELVHVVQFISTYEL